MEKLIKFFISRYVISIAFLLTVIFGGCQKAPINGDLDGYWQVMKVTPEPTEEIITTRMYMSIYMHTVQLNYVTGGGWNVGNIKYEGKTLSMDFPYAVDNEVALTMMRQYGINSNPVVFTIEKLTKDKLVLRDGDTVVELRKF